MAILESIKSPQDIKALGDNELNQLCMELRKCIIDTVMLNGGHFASNLGAVELTVALHRALNAPHDAIVWDVGHQAYAHKLLTGRYAAFSTLRTLNGISGFLRRDESEYDSFGAGHASTALSAALGMARARDIKGQNFAVAAVVGDGALTGGMCWEALNDAGHRKTPFIMVLNDNGMSIARNVGAISTFLAKARGNPSWWRLKSRVQQMLERLPVGGHALSFLLRWFKDSIKRLVVPGVMFEELGFAYLGPINGHNIPHVEATLRRANAMQIPVVVHVVTKKGHGWLPAERDPREYHGVAPYLIETAENLHLTATGSVVSEVLCREAETQQNICAITAAMPDGTGLARFAERFPQRFFDVGIAEEHAMTLAAGLAVGGMKPCFAVYSTFWQRAVDQWMHDVCQQKLPVLLLLDRAGLVGEDGPTHHGLSDIAWLRSTPGAVALAPSDAKTLGEMLRWALRQSGPVAIRYPKNLPDVLPFPETPLPHWPRYYVGAEAANAVLIAVGRMAAIALEAREKLLLSGILAEVWDARCVSPMDDEALMAVLRSGLPVFTLEDAYLHGGLGEGVAAHLSREAGRLGLPAPTVRCMGVSAEYVKQGTVAQQLAMCGLTAQALAERVKAELGHV